jgi:hypothetical protein
MGLNVKHLGCLSPNRKEKDGDDQMTTQALNLPLDITWQRFGYSRDMIDTNFGDLNLPPKWRSSMAVYSYVVPREQTAESYPNARIVYLRLTCSITGWNPSEDLLNAVDLENNGDQLDDVQKSLWEVIRADGWAKTYWPCLGAIVQIGIYPGQGDGEVGPDNYPYILDFEPKKRELYETRSETGEFLSGSSDKIDVQKGHTTTNSVEHSSIITGGGVSIPTGSDSAIGVNVSGEWGTRRNDSKESHDITTTDKSRERRETTSFNTTFNQMYQLFNGYHLGTNRAVFSVIPRPHVVNDAKQVPFNMIRGQRQLEGLQDMFLVVYVPDVLSGICIQANLDTGHRAMFSSGVAYAIKGDEIPGGISPGFGGPSLPTLPFPGDDKLAPPNEYHLIVTRRIIRNCGTFNDESGMLTPTGDPTNFSEFLPRITFETRLPGPKPEIENQLFRARSGEQETPFEAANQFNRFQHEVTSAMLSGFSTDQYKSRPFVQTETFRRLLYLTLRNVPLELSQLAKQGHLTRADSQSIQRAGAKTVADLFGKEILRGIDQKRLNSVRSKVLEAVMAATRNKKPHE